MLAKCTLESFIFGVMYGLYFLKYTKSNLLYFSGRWQYPSWKSIFGHFAAIAIICGVFGGIFIVLIPKLVKVTFLIYLSNTLGMVLIGFSLVYVLPIIEKFFNLIRYYDTEDLIVEKQLNNLNSPAGSNGYQSVMLS